MEFRQFIQSFFKRIGLKEKHINLFTDDESMILFLIAFTHKSYDEDDNYEFIELIGDTTINKAVIKYITEWDTKIVSVKYLTRLKHNIISKKQLGLMADSEDFYKYVRISEEYKNKFKDYSKDFLLKNKDYLSLLEDCLEAFIGTVELVVDNKQPRMGYQIAYEILKTIFFEKLEISLEYYDIFDAKTIFKELCDKRSWPFDKVVITKQIESELNKSKFYVEVYGFPYNKQDAIEENKELLANYTHTLKAEAQNEACRIALKVLKKKYSIFDIAPNPYEKNKTKIYIKND